MATLTQEEIDQCRTVFHKYNNNKKKFDKEDGECIDLWGLRNVLEEMGQTPTEAEVFSMIIDAEEDASGSINFAEFLHIIEQQKIRQLGQDKQNDMIDAFVACGGDEDLGGCVRKETLISIIKDEFSLPIDIERLINEIDTDGSGEIEYDEMVELLGGA
jgi:Ca2+-binding EF-hand superfamily protein